MEGFQAVICICLFAIAHIHIVRSADHNLLTLGVSPQDENYYVSARIKCKDGSKSFPRERLNDNFCDCPDGTDEPGTPACPEGKFYCRNVGHTPLVLYSSRVNDGICDCCDGSDEYDGKISCKNTCWEAGKATREKLKKKIATFKEGSAMRRKEIEHAKQMIAKEKAELTSLKDEEKQLKKLVDELKEAKDAVEKAEEEQRKKEKEEIEKREAEMLLKDKETSQPIESTNHDSEHMPEQILESTKQDAGSVADENKSNKDSSTDITVDEIPEKEESKELDETEGLSREELGRLVASRWTGENTGHKESGDKGSDSEQKEDIEKVDSEEGNHHEGYDEYASEDEEAYDDNEEEYERVEEKEEDDRLEERTDEFEEEVDEDVTDSRDSEEEGKKQGLWSSSGISWWDKIQKSIRSILQAIKIPRSIDVSKAAQIRKEYDDLSRKLSKIQSRISSLEKKLKQDFGIDGEFYSFYNQCFEQKENKYVYKVCPYKQASQNEGHSTTELGRWNGFKDSYRAMEFSNGARCWNGPDRNMNVRLKCGLKNELVDVDEPSRCEYIATLLTPALCREERLQELQKRLDLLNQSIEVHDEL